MERIIDMHLHVGRRFEWTEKAQAVRMNTGPYVPRLFDRENRQIARSAGCALLPRCMRGGHV